MKLQIQDWWTPRWTPLRERGVIQLTGQRLEYRNCTARFQVVAAGGRSLKTEIAKRKLIEKFCLNVFTSPNGNVDSQGRVDERYFFAAPTRDQAKEIAWDDIRAFIPKELIADVNYSKLYVEHICGPRLYVLGVDKPQRMEGKPWNYGVFSEFADMKEGTWEANFRPLFADRLGGCIIESRPDFDKPNNDKFKELFEKGRSGDPNWKSFQWHSRDVLDPNELEEAYTTMSQTMVDQEFGGSFVTAPGRAYPEFQAMDHVNDTIAAYDHRLPVIVSCDFNAEHHNWGIYQVGNDHVYRAIDEVYVQGGTVESMVIALKDKLDQYRQVKSSALNVREVSMRDLNLVFTGDFSGTQRRAEATYSAWQQIEQAFTERVQGYKLPIRIAEFVYRVQPPIANRINLVRAALKNGNNEVHLYVSSRCPNLIRDFEKVTRKMLFSESKSGLLTHASDNCGYMIDQTQEEFQRKELFRRR